MASKRRSFISLIFIIHCITKCYFYCCYCCCYQCSCCCGGGGGGVVRER